MPKSQVFPLITCLLAAIGQVGRCEDGWIQADGVRVHYVSSGQGDTVLLLHGITGSSSDWDAGQESGVKVFSTLAKNYRVVAMDFRGHGLSDKPRFLANVDGKALAALMEAATGGPKKPGIGPSELASVRIPVLVMFGSREIDEHEMGRIKRFAEHCKASTHIIEGAGHGDIVNREQVIAILQDHLERS